MAITLEQYEALGPESIRALLYDEYGDVPRTDDDTDPRRFAAFELKV